MAIAAELGFASAEADELLTWITTGLRVTDGETTGRAAAVWSNLADGERYLRLYLDRERFGSPWLVARAVDWRPCSAAD